MPDMLAIISKAQFEQLYPTAGLGQVLPIDGYDSSHRGLNPLAEGGTLYLVTVRPPDEELWLVAVLLQPTFDGTRWVTQTNAHPITLLDGIRDRLRFSTGKGLTSRRGALGMSLQTPRELTSEDVSLLRLALSRTKTLGKYQAPAPWAPARAAEPAVADEAESPPVPPEKRSCYLLTLPSPTEPTRVDVFCARTPEASAKWLAWAVSDKRGRESTQGLIDLALKGGLQATCWLVEDGRLAGPRDLSRLLLLRTEDALEVPVGSSNVAALARRLARSEDADVELEADLNGIARELPALAHPLDAEQSIPLTSEDLERARLPRGCTRLGARLSDGSFPDFDPDPPPLREVAVPAAATELFDAVYAAPDDDELREVLADALEEVGHPRGRFLRLQLSRSPGERPSFEEEELLRRHGSEWLGPLCNLFPQQEWAGRVRWERGFLHALSGFEVYPALITRPELATVRELDCGWANRAMLSPVLRGVEVITGVRTPEWLNVIAGNKLPRLERLHLDDLAMAAWDEVGQWPDHGLLVLCEFPPLPSLKRLCFPGVASWLRGVSVAGQLESIHVTRPNAVQDCASWLREWLELAPALQVPVLELGLVTETAIRLTRGSSTAEVRPGSYARIYLPIIQEAGLATGAFTALRLAVDEPSEEVLDFAKKARLPVELIPVASFDRHSYLTARGPRTS